MRRMSSSPFSSCSPPSILKWWWSLTRGCRETGREQNDMMYWSHPFSSPAWGHIEDKEGAGCRYSIASWFSWSAPISSLASLPSLLLLLFLCLCLLWLSPSSLSCLRRLLLLQESEGGQSETRAKDRRKEEKSEMDKDRWMINKTTAGEGTRGQRGGMMGNWSRRRYLSIRREKDEKSKEMLFLPSLSAQTFQIFLKELRLTEV